MRRYETSSVVWLHIYPVLTGVYSALCRVRLSYWCVQCTVQSKAVLLVYSALCRVRLSYCLTGVYSALCRVRLSFSDGIKTFGRLQLWKKNEKHSFVLPSSKQPEICDSRDFWSSVHSLR
jgi:hypothetical protein